MDNKHENFYYFDFEKEFNEGYEIQCPGCMNWGKVPEWGHIDIFCDT